VIDSFKQGNNLATKYREVTMKVTVKDGIKGFSGKLDGAIYYYHPRLKRTLMRRAPQMPIQEKNLEYAAIAKQIKAINPSEAYRY